MAQLIKIPELTKALTPTKLAGLSLRNRVIKTATFEGMCPAGVPTQDLIDHHTAIAAGGAALTTVAYCGVSPDSRTFGDQMYMHQGIFDGLQKLASSVHDQGGAVSGQLSHCGFFSRNKPRDSRRPLGPSPVLNQYGLFSGIPFGGAMGIKDMDKVVKEYADAARFLKRVGFDALEIHMGHGYLLSQFISPATNKRTDDYGGSLHNRMRLPLRILESVRQAVGDDFPLLAKLNLRDGFRGGLEINESVECAKLLEAAGLNAIVMSGGFTSRTPMYLFRGQSPLQQMIPLEPNPLLRTAMKWFGGRLFRNYPFEELYFLEQAKQMLDAVSIPLVYLGGVSSAGAIERAMSSGFDFVAMGRALIKDPQMINQLKTEQHYSSDCNHCNGCVASMALPGGIRCVLDQPNCFNATN